MSARNCAVGALRSKSIYVQYIRIGRRETDDDDYCTIYIFNIRGHHIYLRNGLADDDCDRSLSVDTLTEGNARQRRHSLLMEKRIRAAQQGETL